MTTPGGVALLAPNDQQDSVPAAISNTNAGCSSTVESNCLNNYTTSWPHPANIVYGTALSTLQLDATASIAGTFTYSPAKGTVLHAGADQTLSATFTPADQCEYRGVVVTTTINVTPAPLIITANNATKVYGAGMPQLSASYTGFVNGDSPASLSAAPTLSTTATSASPVLAGGYAIVASGASDPDYTISYRPGTLLITPAPLTITANNATKVYGAGMPQLSASYSGFVNGDSPASLSAAPTLSTTATSASPVLAGGYAIVAAGAVDPDYTISYRPGTLLITPAPLTITANNATKVYGAGMPQLSASYSGFVNGDSPASLSAAPTLSTTATSASPVLAGGYAIVAAGASDPDYTISYRPGACSSRRPR